MAPTYSRRHGLLLLLLCQTRTHARCEGQTKKKYRVVVRSLVSSSERGLSPFDWVGGGGQMAELSAPVKRKFWIGAVPMRIRSIRITDRPTEVLTEQRVGGRYGDGTDFVLSV